MYCARFKLRSASTYHKGRKPRGCHETGLGSLLGVPELSILPFERLEGHRLPSVVGKTMSLARLMDDLVANEIT